VGWNLHTRGERGRGGANFPKDEMLPGAPAHKEHCWVHKSQFSRWGAIPITCKQCKQLENLLSRPKGLPTWESPVEDHAGIHGVSWDGANHGYY